MKMIHLRYIHIQGTEEYSGKPHQRAGTEWKSGGNVSEEPHLGEVFLKDQ